MNKATMPASCNEKSCLFLTVLCGLFPRVRDGNNYNSSIYVLSKSTDDIPNTSMVTSVFTTT